MDGDDRSRLPIPYHCVDNRIHIVAKLLALAKRQVVGGVCGKQAMGVEIAACVVSLGVIQVLVVRTCWRRRRLRTPGTSILRFEISCSPYPRLFPLPNTFRT